MPSGFRPRNLEPSPPTWQDYLDNAATAPRKTSTSSNGQNTVVDGPDDWRGFVSTGGVSTGYPSYWQTSGPMRGTDIGYWTATDGRHPTLGIDPFGRGAFGAVGLGGFGRGTQNDSDTASAWESYMGRWLAQNLPSAQTSTTPPRATTTAPPTAAPSSGGAPSSPTQTTSGPTAAPTTTATPASPAAPAASQSQSTRSSGYPTSTADPYGRDPDGIGYGRGWTDEELYARALADAEASLTDPVVDPNQALYDMINASGGGGGGGRVNNFDYGAAIQGLMNSGMFDAVGVPQLQNYSQPLMQAAAQLPQFQQWNPEMLAAPDFSGQYDNITALADQTRGQINDAYNPVLQALSSQVPSAVGAVTGTAQQLSPELQAFADSQGIGSGYAADLATQNQGIQSAADLFSGRNQMLDRVFQNQRQSTADIARQSQAGALSNASTQQMLTQAALDQIAQQAQIQNAQYNNGLLNQAGQYNTQGMNDYGSRQAMLNNEASVGNTNALNAWLQSNTDIANQQSMLGYDVANQSNNNRMQAILQMIADAAANGVALDPSVYGMVA